MFGSPIDGFELFAVNDDPHAFIVQYNGRMVSVNTWEQDPEGNIRLTSSLHRQALFMDHETQMMSADLEQCAAIALAKYGLATTTRA
jgi:hypothetical protein